MRIDEPKPFRNKEGKQIVWNPILVQTAPDRGRLVFLQTLCAKCEEYETSCKKLRQTGFHKLPATTNKETKKTMDLPPGDYICRRFATTTFRNAARTILFLLPLGEDGEPATDAETPTHGFFLEKAVAELGGAEELEKRKKTLFCRLGEEKTTQNKRKCRRVASV